tara:strand:- start:165 stop:344 length:180 start_codon:yes stop_codon:yes gene_type:complete
MEKVKISHPVANEFIGCRGKNYSVLNINKASKPNLFILKSIAASFAGASIPAAIFYFMM